METTYQLRAELAFRIRTRAPEDWKEFSGIWIAFNAIYGGEADQSERSRVMRCIRRNLSETAALSVLNSASKHIDKLLALPPGNMLLERYDPKFRAASIRCAALYLDNGETACGRLAGVAGVLYQVRCNLIHGSKDPDSARDCMLIKESLAVLKALLPELEASFAIRNSV